MAIPIGVLIILLVFSVASAVLAVCLCIVSGRCSRREEAQPYRDVVKTGGNSRGWRDI
jgi:hypothetical protein